MKEIDTRQRNRQWAKHERWKTVCFPPLAASVSTAGAWRRKEKNKKVKTHLLFQYETYCEGHNDEDEDEGDDGVCEGGRNK